MESVFSFPKGFFYETVLPFYFWNVLYSKSGCSSMSVPSVFKKERQIDRQRRVRL